MNVGNERWMDTRGIRVLEKVMDEEEKERRKRRMLDGKVEMEDIDEEVDEEWRINECIM